MTSDIVLEALQSMEFTQDLEPKQLEKLASIATYVTFSEGATIFREGDTSELVYLIMEGEVSLLTQVPGHGQVTILTIEPGQLLGWSSLFPPQKKTAGAQTNAPTKAIAINAVQLHELCTDDHDIGFEIMSRVAQVISNRLSAARDLLLDMFEPSKEKKQRRK
ncbi:MAG: Crp/Fnr family transcriptional regulator [Anaerolineales bacterium]|nr:MAG: Crp/Fnr family transcriptional regulator [Anaerolineales bacterium]